ncbi:hypothetical protein HZ994_17480 [Akkermansiaceae bacterium]|nr:hypothetical protein HZ994_17480 [Akkermansiaceae bacterium]
MNNTSPKTSGRFTATCVGVVLMTTCYHPPHRRTPDWDLEPGEKKPDRLTAHQQRATQPPAAPSDFSPDAGAANRRPGNPFSEFRIGRETILTEEPPLPPSQFNPDPGQGWTEETVDEEKPVTEGRDNPFFNESGLTKRPFFENDADPGNSGFFGNDAGFTQGGRRFVPDIPEGMVLPRRGVEQNRIDIEIVEHGPEEPFDPDITKAFELPRGDIRFEERIYEHWHAGHYDHAEDPANMTSVEDRWNIATGKWQRYEDDSIAETPYARSTPYLWHPYYQSKYKGDVPVRGQDIFASFTLQSFSELETRSIPTPAGVSTARGGNAEFYGRGEQAGIVTNTSLTFDLFRGETSFKPVEWLFRIQPVFNTNYVSVDETSLISPDPRGLNQSTGSAPPSGFGTNPGGLNPGDIDFFLDPLLFPAGGDFRGSKATERFQNHFALQQFFLETHLLDVSENYDFAAMRVGTQTFNADFRGHVFFDSNWGYRLLGNLNKNRIQYNIALFDLFEKESFSELNTWDDRDQTVFVANLYWQDLFIEGYTSQISFLANWDKGSDAGLTFDSAGNIARPTPIGTIAAHDLEAYYLGWNGEGHFGRLNISHSLYHVFGEDDLNGLAGQSVDIDAWMAALELSVDTDWMRHKLTFFWASGDDDATDGTAKGWDSIVDSPNLVGGPFSYWQRQGPNLGGTAVALKQRLSLIPNLRSSKFLGQSSFVNPGIFIAGIGEEWELTPRLRFFANLNYMLFMETDPLSTALLTGGIDREIGWDLSFGMEYRPYLTDNVRLVAGLGMLFPGKGLKDIYRISNPAAGGFSSGGSGDIDGVLYSGFLSATMTF